MACDKCGQQVGRIVIDGGAGVCEECLVSPDYRPSDV